MFYPVYKSTFSHYANTERSIQGYQMAEHYADQSTPAAAGGYRVGPAALQYRSYHALSAGAKGNAPDKV